MIGVTCGHVLLFIVQGPSFPVSYVSTAVGVIFLFDYVRLPVAGDLNGVIMAFCFFYCTRVNCVFY